MLGSGVVPAERPRSGADPRSLDFAALLDQARAGGVRSGLTVSVDPDLDLDLAPDKLEQLSQIADLAQAQGLDRVLVIDGSDRLVLDVERRTIVGRGEGAGELLSGFDAMYELSSTLAPGEVASGTPDASVSARRLLDLLGSNRSPQVI
ncbi:MAG: hypothetical protein DYG94_09005 [Leptolyngbya sp. PLA3]|nr:MAG: hypothetical protein EDM82_02790 [Cyanobacteria bacterium CYA]MCE7968869.1 hypothetical protein [Leptolyngbya sp. PL-A3]